MDHSRDGRGKGEVPARYARERLRRLLVVDVFETGTLGVLFLTGKAKRKHYPDAADAADYQYFLSLVWVPLYFIVYWMPRLL